MPAEATRVGIVGAAGRGRSFLAGLRAGGARIQAVCDTQADRLAECAAQMGATETYTDYERMLEEANLEAVIIGTPMHLHVVQSIAALERGLHVLCEVPAGVSVEECRALTIACRKSRGLYMLSENANYYEQCMLVEELCRQGLFGEVYYAEGEYLHELKDLNERTPWRRKWQTGIAGITYGTHNLGPILRWMKGDRVTRVCCENTGSHYKDPRDEPYAQDSATMLCKTARGALIKIRVDMISDRPHALANYQLQGTDGAFESSRGGPVDRGRIWLRALSREIRWHDLEELMTMDELAGRYLPEVWRKIAPEALKAGHGGIDFLAGADFLNAVRMGTTSPIGIDEAMDMTLPGLVSQQSVLQGGAWRGVPDSRKWTTDAPPSPQLQMVWPKELLDSPPEVQVPDGYRLRQYTAADEAGYIQLMNKAGFVGWTHETVVEYSKPVLPGGFFLIEHCASGRIVATAVSQHYPTELHPYGGQLGWVAADPEHKGRGLGRAVSAAATARMLAAGYTDIFLSTDDWRLPAIKIYLDMGYRPLLFCEGMQERWAAILVKLGREP